MGWERVLLLLFYLLIRTTFSMGNIGITCISSALIPIGLRKGQEPTHPAGTSVGSVGYDKPVHSASHYGQWGHFFLACSQTNSVENPFISQSSLDLGMIGCLDRFLS